MHSKRQVPIAVVGVGALMPGATGAGDFWRVVLEGQDLITDVPPERWRTEDHYDPDPSAPDRTYGRRGAFLPEVDFEPIAYGVPPMTLPATDTSQLLALMVAESVFADMVTGLGDRERVSVVLGTGVLELGTHMAGRHHRPLWMSALRDSGISEEQANAVCDRIAAQFTPWQEASFPGLLPNVVAGRIANKFDLHGMNHTTDAACASSLAAVSTAVAELSLGRADLVLAGGVDTLNDIFMFMCFSKTPALSRSGDCRPFSDAADGTLLGEGLAMFALKRLDDAEREGDQIYAVVRGIGASSDGRSTAIYAPLPEGQARALRRAYESAGYGPETVELVEAHGTGTSAGDLAEFTALREVFSRSGRTDQQWCALGSVKSQIGHTKSAAGAAGMLKAVLALQHKVLPPTIKVDRPNPALDLAESPFYVNTVARPWIRGSDHPRRASVSSFGFGGTNFHVALEEYVPSSARHRVAPTELVLFSANKSEELLAKIRDQLSGDFASIARTSQDAFRHDDPARLAIVAPDLAGLTNRLTEAGDWIERHPAAALSSPSGVHYSVSEPQTGRMAFLFPGQGAQYVGMGSGLALHLSAAQDVWDRYGSTVFDGEALHRKVFPPPAFDDDERARRQAQLTATEWAQPALAVHSMALLAVLRSLRLTADSVAGHSFGEITALHAAGAFDEDTLVRLARIRGELMRAAADRPGAMLAVTGTRDEIAAAIVHCGSSELWLANHNSPTQCAVSGTLDGISALTAHLDRLGVRTRRLDAATAFHSPVVASAVDPFLDILAQADIRSPKLDVYGNTDAARYPGDPDKIRHRVAEHLAAPVQFVDQIEAMYADGVRTFVEVGAGATLTGLVGQILDGREHLAIDLDRRGRDAITSLHDGLARLSVAGIALDLNALWHGYRTAVAPVETTGRMTVRINGGNIPAPPVDLPPVVVEPPVSTELLDVFEEAQRQAAEAHSAYQRMLTDSHMAFMTMWESSFDALLGVPESPVIPQLPEPATHPEPPPVAPTVIPDPPSVDLESLLLSVVADRTGYPESTLRLDMELEADLGIDSIKRVEILSAVRKQVGELPQDAVAELARMRTLAEIVERIRHASSPPEPVLVDRLVLEAEPAAAPGVPMFGLDSGLIAVLGDAAIASALVSIMESRGVRAVAADSVPTEATGVVYLGGLSSVDKHRDALDVARAVDGRLFVLVQDTGGDFGVEGSARAWLGGLAGLARTAAREWPNAAVKAIDCEQHGRTPAEIAEVIAHEMLFGGPDLDVGLRADGTRLVPRWVPATAEVSGPLRIGAGSVIVASGGARGVTATALLALARAHRPRLVLIGRTPLVSEPDWLAPATDAPALTRLLSERHTYERPADLAAEVRRTLGVREIRATIEELERAGSPVRYLAVDVRDAEAVAKALAGVRQEWGSITGLVHGAGVLADRRIADKTHEQFDRVFGTKVEGLRSLLDATAADPLEVICLFSSVSGVFGNAGQSDYAMANEVMNQVASAERRRRPDCWVRSIAWGPWRAGMVTPELAENFERGGVALLSPETGAQAFLAELASAGDARVVIAAAHSSAELNVSLHSHPFLADHAPGDVPVLPMAIALDRLANGVHIGLSDIRVLGTASLPDLASGHRFAVVQQAGELELRTDSGARLYRARAIDSSTARSWAEPANLLPLNRSDPYDGPTLFHGPAFRALRSVRGVGVGGAVGTVIGASPLGWPDGGWFADPAAVDGGLQLALLWAEVALGGPSLPMAVREYRIVRRGPIDSASCVVVAGIVDGSTAQCDIALLDSAGASIVELLGVELVRRPR